MARSCILTSVHGPISRMRIMSFTFRGKHSCCLWMRGAAQTLGITHCYAVSFLQSSVFHEDSQPSWLRVQYTTVFKEKALNNEGRSQFCFFFFWHSVNENIIDTRVLSLSDLLKQVPRNTCMAGDLACISVCFSHCSLWLHG